MKPTNDTRSATENVQVFLRMRPTNERELKNNELNLWILGKNYARLNVERYNLLFKQHKVRSAPYTKPCFFNRCFSSESTNSTIYNQILRTLVKGSLNGINGTLFLYGQTGAGKTYTMMGDYSEEIVSSKYRIKRNRASSRVSHRMSVTPTSSERAHTPIAKLKNGQSHFTISTDKEPDKEPVNEGVLIHALKDLFLQIEKAKSDKREFFVRCSYFEIYNDSIYDLLTTVERFSEPLAISEDSNVLSP